MKHNFFIDDISQTFCINCFSENSLSNCLGNGKYHHKIVPYKNTKDFICIKCNIPFYEDDEIIDNKIVRIHYKDGNICQKNIGTKYFESLCIYTDDEADAKEIIE